MLKLRMETSDWLAALSATIDKAEFEADVENPIEVYGDLADDLCCRVLDRLSGLGVDYERAYQQSRGTEIIIQGGPDKEQRLFWASMWAAQADIYPSVLRAARELAIAD